MTAASGIVAGARILASAGRDVYPQAAIKTVDQSDPFSQPPALAADQELHLAVAASSAYLFCCYLNYEGDDDTRPDGGIAYEWTVPSGATMRYTTIGRTFGGGSQVHTTQQEATSYHLGSTGSGTLMAALMTGTLVTGTASGTLQLTWSAFEWVNLRPETIVHAQSFVALWQLSP